MSDARGLYGLGMAGVSAGLMLLGVYSVYAQNALPDNVLNAAEDHACALKTLKSGDRTILAEQNFACLLAKVVELESELKPFREAVGAIVAFDTPTGCPVGWTQFEAGAGRMIVGVGGKYELPYVGGEPRYQIDGAETHTLEIEEMPRHSHKIPFDEREGNGGGHRYGTPTSLDDGRSTSLVGGTDVMQAGEALPHNNMPPYIALYFCKKES